MELNDATAALAALGQPTRLSVFRLLVEAGPEGSTPSQIADVLSLPGATLSFHLKELTSAGLIEGEAQGRNIIYRADFEAMNGLIEFLTRNCCGGDESRCLPGSRASRKGTRKTREA
ncbi:transcriptional regulator [Lysobacteraceae bacterium NML91-0213]|nr:transcriptional regulator [Xanthomonadaceae bacterium NML91-0213]